MTNIITNIEQALKPLIPKASEILIATAMTSEYGVNLLKKAKKGCKVKLVTGIDLPTSIDVLKSIRTSYGDCARVYLHEFYHPKVYVIKFSDGKANAIVGSGNFTQNGFTENIELSYLITDKSDCEAILAWFDDIYAKSQLISNSFLNKYKDYSSTWTKQRNIRKKELKDIIENQNKINVDNANLIHELTKKIISKECQERIKGRKNVLKSLKKALDIDNDFKDIKVDTFTYGQQELGHIIPIYKNRWHDYVKDGSLRKLCKMLCDESVDIELRIKRAFDKTDLGLYGISNNFITKILCVYNPNEYILWNKALDVFMKDFHFEFEDGTREWTKYKMLCEHFKPIMKQVGLKNFAELDAVLYDAMLEVKK